MFNRFSVTVGRRYATSRRGSHLVSFISRVSVVGLIVSVALLVLVMSIMNGFDRELRQRILQVLPQATIYHRDGIAEPDRLRRQIDAHPQVVASAPFVKLQGLLARGQSVAPAVVFGIEPGQERGVSDLERYLRAGQLQRLAINPRGVIVGAALAETLALKRGDRLSLVIPRAGLSRSVPEIEALEVVDILDTGTEIDNATALVPLALASRLSEHPGRISGIRLKVEDLFAAGAVVQDLTASLPAGYYGSDWSRTHGNLYRAIHMSKRLVGLLLMLLIGIAAFNLVSTLIMVVVDKQADIAILRTQGASGREIVAIFLVQGGIIGLKGTLLGALAGAGLSLVVTPAVAWLEQLAGIQFLHSDVYPVSYLPADLRLADLVTISVAALLLSLLASVYPAWRAARVLPAEALRHD